MRVGVVGVGAMGENHVRIYSTMDTCELVGVTDKDMARAGEVAKKYNTKAMNMDEMVREDLDAVSIVVPTSLHRDVAMKFIKEGINCLVEKPIASSLPEAQEIIDEAKRSKVKLMVGHIERFNPAVLKLSEIIRKGGLGDILLLSARRVGPFTPRIRDVGIITDMATHEIDVMRFLTGKEPNKICSVYGSYKHPKEDHAMIIMDFGGTIGSIEVNWFTPVKVRTLIATGTQMTAQLNYIDQTIDLYGSSGKSSVEVVKEEPLRVELRHFVECVREGKEPLVNGEEGIKDLGVALKALEKGKKEKNS